MQSHVPVLVLVRVLVLMLLPVLVLELDGVTGVVGASKLVPAS